MNEEKSRKYLLWLVAIGFFMQTLDSTSANTALPAMARDLGESPLRMQSVVQALPAFHATFVAMGLITSASAWIFRQLSPDIRADDKPTESAEIV